MEPGQTGSGNESGNTVLSVGVWKAFDVVCDTAVLLILEACWLGYRRFGEIRRSTGLQKALLSDRLKYLVKEDILDRRVPEGRRQAAYYLQPMGLDLFPVALSMLAWERRWNEGEGPDIQVMHTSCGSRLDTDIICLACREPVRPGDIEAIPGEAFYKGQRGFVKRRRQAGLNRGQTWMFHEIAEIVGDRWLALILRLCFVGVRRFDDFLQATGMASNILADRLVQAHDYGLLDRVAYQSNPPRHEYLMTGKCRDLLPVILTLRAWGQKWYGGPVDDHASLKHSCGANLETGIICKHCGDAAALDTCELALRPAG